MLVTAPFALADKKEDLYSKAMTAVNAGDSLAARDNFCAAAKEDSSYKDAAAKCSEYTQAAERTLNRYKVNFAEGDAALKNGDFATAEQKFRNVKAGEYAEQAKAKLVEVARLKKDKEAADLAAQQNANLDVQMRQKLDQGMAAFNSGDVATARTLLASISGTHQQEAQNSLKKVNDYTAKMNEAQALAATRNYSGAVSAYGSAMALFPNGPGNPQGEMAKMVTAAQTAATQQVTPPNPNPGNPVNNVKPPVPVRTIDVALYLADGHKAMAKGDFKKARRFFQEVLGQDKSNQDAMDGLKELTSKDTAQAKATDEDPLLSTCIDKFYSGSYDEVVYRLNNYIYTNQGKKMGLANFYLGATLLTRYYLSGSSDENLRKQAVEKFKSAKAVDGFKPPDKFVSPKIMKVFDAS